VVSPLDALSPCEKSGEVLRSKAQVNSAIIKYLAKALHYVGQLVVES
jgi:hypothetical protein